MQNSFYLGLLMASLIFLSCHSSQLQSNAEEMGGAKIKRRTPDKTSTETVSPEPKKVRAPQARDVRHFISIYQKTLEVLGKKKEDSSYIVDAETIDEMKQQISRLLQAEPNSTTFLINPRTESAWFGNCALVVDKKQEKLFILDKDGVEQSLNLRDKIFGGLYKSEEGDWVFLSAFYGDLQKKVPYRVFWGATELKTLSFTFDRTKEGTVEGQAKTPTGKILKFYRKARDNKSVLVNGQTLSPVFE